MPTVARKATGAPSRPFVRAAHKLIQPACQFTTAIFGAARQDFGPFDIPSGGYLRDLIIHGKVSGTTIGPGAVGPDFPWSMIRSVELADVNGQALTYPVISGFDEYIHNLLGGFQYHGDPAFISADPFDISAADFYLRVPVEIDHTDGYGALPNLNAAEPYRLRLTVGSEADIYPTPPTTDGLLTVKVYARDWSLPAATDGLGNAQAVSPPDMNTTQYLSKFVVPINAGTNTIRLTRTGNLLRNVYLITRDSIGARIAGLPDDLVYSWDKYQLSKCPGEIFRLQNAENGLVHDYTLSPLTMPLGVYALQYNEDGGSPSAEKRNLWLPTMQPTQLMLEGTFPAPMTGGTLEIITNDVAASVS